MNMYPFKFKPVYKEKIWGGNKLNKVFSRNLPEANIGESWEVAAHPHGTSIIKNGVFKNKTLPQLIRKYPLEILGNKFKSKTEHFPLLIKLLDANAKLSVQVHPDDNYARKVENEPGKTEMWYIIDATPGAKLVYGLKEGTTKKAFTQAIQKGKIEDFLHEIEVKKGDIFYMPSGTVHAIEEGILIAEIQQNSDTTYRVYDWNRVDAQGKSRALHIAKALEVIDFSANDDKHKVKPVVITNPDYTLEILVACPHFVTEKINIKNNLSIKPAGERFYILIPLSGEGNLIYKEQEYILTPGETVFLPATLAESKITGNVELLRTFLPVDRDDINNIYRQKGLKEDKIKNITGIDEF